MTERAEHQRKAIYNVKPIKTKQELEDLQLDDDTIVCISCNNGMGNTYHWWDKKDCIESEED